MTKMYNNPRAAMFNLNISPLMIEGFMVNHTELLALMPEAVPTEDCAIYGMLPTLFDASPKRREKRRESALDKHLLSALNK